MNKKVLLVILSIIIILAVLAGCIFAYKHFTNKEEVNLNKEETETSKIEIDKTPIFTKDTYPKVDASLATQPLTNAFIKNFVGEDVDTSKIEYTNTHPGYVNLINGKNDLIVVTEPSSEELALAKKKGVELEVIPVVKEGFVFYVNSNNPVDSLSIEQIQKIYTGEIKNWSEVGGNDEKIVAFQRPENSGSQTGMLSLVMKDLKLMKPKTEDLIETMAEIVNLVSNYDNGKASIGYSYYYYATTMYEDIDKSVAEGIKLLKINGVEPNDDTIGKEEYPLKTAYYIVMRKDEPEGSNARKLAEAMLSERGQAVAKEAGYVPVK